jgi:hypothetical protein
MKKGADVRGGEIMYGLAQLAFKEKNMYMSKCVCVYTRVSVSE